MENHRRQADLKQSAIPSTLHHEGAARFWLAVVFTGIATGLGAALLTRLLAWVQRFAWHGSATDILSAAQHASLLRHVIVLATAAVLTGAGQLVLKRLSSGNGIDTTEAIWFDAGRMPALRTLGSAVLSVVDVALGVSLGREGAPKQAGAIFANASCDWGRLSDEQRQLLVACGAGAGMGAAYGVPLGGALFALEVMRGKLALRFVLPALFTSVIATGVSWLFLPDAPTYDIPSFPVTSSVLVWTLVAGPLLGLVSVGYVRAITWADRNRPHGWARFTTPAVVLVSLGLTSFWFPQILGNGKDLSQLLFIGKATVPLILALVVLKPLATVWCLRSGAPGGMFTPSLTAGALLGSLLGAGWSLLWPGTPIGLFALLGAAAVIAATTQGPISAVVLVMELTGRDRSFILPLLSVVCLATLMARTLEPRSIYDARLSEEQIAERQRQRDLPAR